jgi:hypothetical protein
MISFIRTRRGGGGTTKFTQVVDEKLTKEESESDESEEEYTKNSMQKHENDKRNMIPKHDNDKNMIPKHENDKRNMMPKKNNPSSNDTGVYYYDDKNKKGVVIMSIKPPPPIASDDDVNNKFKKEIELKKTKKKIIQVEKKNNNDLNASKVWRNVYGLGFGTFCMSYCIQMPSRQCNTFLCSTMWLISLKDFFSFTSNNDGSDLRRMDRKGIVSYYQKASRSDCNNYVLLPAMIGLYGVISILMFFNMPVPHSIEFGFINSFIPIIGPIAMQYINIKKPSVNISETIELGSPVAALLSMCVICTFLSSQTECISQRFMSPSNQITISNNNNTTTSITTTSNTISSMVISGIMNSDHPLKIYPLPVLSTLLGPIAGICALVAITTSYANGRSFDVAVIFLILSISVETWIYLFRSDDEYSAINFIQDPRTIKNGIFLAEIILSTTVGIAMIFYRFGKVVENDREEDEEKSKLSSFEEL